jgi:hypothetical protein
LRIRVLLDECIPVQAAAELPNLEVRTIRGMRWRGKKNGELLQLAEANFVVTMDGALVHQQKISHRRLGIVTMVARSNEIAAWAPAGGAEEPGQVIRVRG